MRGQETSSTSGAFLQRKGSTLSPMSGKSVFHSFHFAVQPWAVLDAKCYSDNNLHASHPFKRQVCGLMFSMMTSVTAVALGHRTAQTVFGKQLAALLQANVLSVRFLSSSIAAVHCCSNDTNCLMMHLTQHCSMTLLQQCK